MPAAPPLEGPAVVAIALLLLGTYIARFNRFFATMRPLQGVAMVPPSCLHPLANARPPFFVGVDLGGTNTKIGLVDDRGRTLGFRSLRTEAEKGPEDTATRMGAAVLEIIDQMGLDQDTVPAVGLGTPGTMDIPAGVMIRPHNLSGWRDVPIRDMLERQCNRPVTFANDAGAAAFGEYWCGSGRDFRSLVLLTLGTGIGGGIIVRDMSIDGEHSHGAEVGHIIIDFHETARVCPCGAKGHLEGYVGASAVIARTGEALATDSHSSIAGRLDAGAPLTPRLLAEEAEKGDALALKLILETARYLGVGIVSLLHTIDPDGVVLGGAMNFGGRDRPVGRQFLEQVRQEVRQRAFPVLAARAVIDFAALGGDAGYIGAAGLARANYHKETSA